MGYYATANGFITIPSENLDKLFLTARMMLNETEKMSGGSMSEKWYAWVDSNQVSESCRKKDIKGLFKAWGFNIENTHCLDEYVVSFDNKKGDEEYFIKKIAQFITRGDIKWCGEDGYLWREEFKDGVLRRTVGRVVYS